MASRFGFGRSQIDEDSIDEIAQGLCEAIEDNDSHSVQRQLFGRIPPKAIVTPVSSKYGLRHMTALHYAAENLSLDGFEIMGALLRSLKDASEIDVRGEGEVHNRQFPRVYNPLNEPTLSLEVEDYTPLTWACLHANHRAVEQLIKRGANVNSSDNHSHITPLIAICARASRDRQQDVDKIILALLRARAEVDASDDLGNTALHYYLQQPPYNLAKRIITTNGKAKSGLLEANTYGWTLLHCCAFYCKEEECRTFITLLLDKTLSESPESNIILARTKNGFTACDLAEKYHNPDAAEILKPLQERAHRQERARRSRSRRYSPLPEGGRFSRPMNTVSESYSRSAATRSDGRGENLAHAPYHSNTQSEDVMPQTWSTSPWTTSNTHLERTTTIMPDVSGLSASVGGSSVRSSSYLNQAPRPFSANDARTSSGSKKKPWATAVDIIIQPRRKPQRKEEPGRQKMAPHAEKLYNEISGAYSQPSSSIREPDTRSERTISTSHRLDHPSNRDLEISLRRPVPDLPEAAEGSADVDWILALSDLLPNWQYLDKVWSDFDMAQPLSTDVKRLEFMGKVICHVLRSQDYQIAVSLGSGLCKRTHTINFMDYNGSLIQRNSIAILGRCLYEANDLDWAQKQLGWARQIFAVDDRKVSVAESWVAFILILRWGEDHRTLAIWLLLSTMKRERSRVGGPDEAPFNSLSSAFYVHFYLAVAVAVFDRNRPGDADRILHALGKKVEFRESFSKHGGSYVGFMEYFLIRSQVYSRYGRFAIAAELLQRALSYQCNMDCWYKPRTVQTAKDLAAALRQIPARAGEADSIYKYAEAIEALRTNPYRLIKLPPRPPAFRQCQHDELFAPLEPTYGLFVQDNSPEAVPPTLDEIEGWLKPLVVPNSEASDLFVAKAWS